MYSKTIYGLALVIAAGISTLNAVRSRKPIRLFWSFLAAAFGAWSINSCVWIYYVLLLGSNRPGYLPANVPLILRTVLMIAAVASRPHLELSRRRGYRATLNLLLLLFFWVFAYTLLLVQQPLTTWDTPRLLRVDALYAGQNLFLLAVLGVLILRAERPWKFIYWHLLGAATLYVLTSLAANLVFAFRGYRLSWVDLAFTTAACWFVWIALQGRRRAAQLEQSVQPDTSGAKYISLLAMLSVVTIPVIGLWELFRTDEPYRTHEIRLFIVLVAVLFLAVVVFIEAYLTNRDLFSEAGLANERFRLAAQAGKMYAYEWDVATDLVEHSAEHTNVLGFIDPGKQLTRQQLLDRVHPDDRALFVNSVRELVPENPITQISYRVVRPDGEEVWLERRARAFFDPDGKMLRMVGMVADITEGKLAEAARRESEEKLRLLLDSTAEGIYGVDLEGGCTFCNPSGIRILGYERAEELIGRNIHDLIHHTRADGTLLPREECRISQASRTGQGVHADDEVLWRADGTCFQAEYWSYPQRRGQQVVGTVTAFIDITARKRAEERLREYERVVEALEDRIIVVDREYRYVVANRMFLEYRNLEKEQVIGHTVAEVIGREPFERDMKEKFEECFRGKVMQFDLTHRYPKLGERSIAVSYHPIEGPTGGVDRIACILRDITERKRSEEALAGVSRKLIEEQEKERARIARELHDNTNQRLALLALKIDQLRDNLPEQTAELRGQVDELRDHTVEISNEVRTVAHELHPPGLEYAGLAGAAKGFCQEFGEQQKMQIDWQTHDVPSRLSAAISLCLFRVLQEALHNSAKHSGARRCEVQLWGTSDEVHLKVSDPGVGFQPEEERENRGLGLISMQERVRLLKGTFSIESKPRHGTAIHVRLPLSTESDSFRAAG